MPINESKLKRMKIPSQDIDEGLDASGSNSKYQTTFILIFLFLKLVTDSFYCPLPYYLMNPNIVCASKNFNEESQSNDPSYIFSCNLNKVCLINKMIDNLKIEKPNITNDNIGGTAQQSFYPNKIEFMLKDTNGKNTFINYFDIYCNTIKIGLIGSSASIGNLISNIISPFFTDNIGRIKTIQLILLFDIFIKFLLFYIKDFTNLLILLTLVNITSNIVYFAACLYINEMVSPEHRGKYSCYFNAFFGLSGILFTIIFYMTFNWIYLNLFSLICSIMSFVLIQILLYESVRFYKINFLNNEIINVLGNIARFNSREHEFYLWKNQFYTKYDLFDNEPLMNHSNEKENINAKDTSQLFGSLVSQKGFCSHSCDYNTADGHFIVKKKIKGNNSPSPFLSKSHHKSYRKFNTRAWEKDASLRNYQKIFESLDVLLSQEQAQQALNPPNASYNRNIENFIYVDCEKVIKEDNNNNYNNKAIRNNNPDNYGTFQDNNNNNNNNNNNKVEEDDYKNNNCLILKSSVRKLPNEHHKTFNFETEIKSVLEPRHSNYQHIKNQKSKIHKLNYYPAKDLANILNLRLNKTYNYGLVEYEITTQTTEDKTLKNLIDENYNHNTNENINLNTSSAINYNRAENPYFIQMSDIFANKAELKSFTIFSYISFVTISGIMYNAIDMKELPDTVYYPLILYATEFLIISIIGHIIDLPSFGRKIPCIFFSLLAGFCYISKYFFEYNYKNNSSTLKSSQNQFKLLDIYQQTNPNFEQDSTYDINRENLGKIFSHSKNFEDFTSKYIQNQPIYYSGNFYSNDYKIKNHMDYESSILNGNNTDSSGILSYKKPLDENILLLIINYFLRFSVSISFNILIEYNFEIYSTDVRSIAFNLNKLFSRFGDFFTPLLMSNHYSLTTLTLGILYIIMSFFIYFLRETRGENLKDEINEKENYKIAFASSKAN